VTTRPKANGRAKAPASAAPVYDLSAFRPIERWRWVKADPEELPPAEGEEPLEAEIKVSLTGLEARKLAPATLPHEELYKLLAPCCRAWTLTGEVVETDADGNETRTRAPVPPPAVAGPDVFLYVEEAVTIWLWNRVKNARFERPDPKESSTPPKSTDGGRPETTDDEDDEDPID
jgi:hypothetical protein